jgi:hypothetical protein
LAKIAKEYDIDEGKVHAIHQGLLASGKTQQEAMAATREQCEAIDRAERGEPPEHGERTLGPQGNPNA